MKNGKIMAAALAIVLLGLAVGGAIMFRDPASGAGADGQGKRGTVDWTVFMYLAGDSNLADYNQMLTNIEFLKKIPPTERVHLLVLLDRNGNGDSRAFELEGSEETEVPMTDIDPGWGDEVNMGDPETLKSFVRWGVADYPARNYNVMLSDHGGGWRGICWDDTDGGDNLDQADLKDSLSYIRDLIGRPIDVLSTEACLMANVETAYQIRDTSTYYVASETYGFGGENTTEGGLLVGNWQFEKVWGALCAHPEMTPEDLAMTMVEHFQIYGPWRGGWYIPKLESSDTMSVMKLDALQELGNATEGLASALVDKLTGVGSTANRAMVKDAVGSPEYLVREYTESFSGQLDHIGLGTFTNYDLYDFALQLSSKPLGLDSQAQAVMDAVDEAVLVEKHGTDPGQGEHPDAHGISVFIPQTQTEYNELYDATDFAQDTGWDEFLKAYW